MVSTQPYLPQDSLALALGGSKAFPDRARLFKFVRQITGKTRRAAVHLLEQVRFGGRSDPAGGAVCAAS
ncbi:MAG: hypothetical protein R3E75_05855 [Steroidobacteraceae bacterium]|nr:hypothetical protein [Nevskiaceae bacterium]MCP5466918.1 hypothetical protein [Nevskiaceae bacterium]MCP5471007.1 hypothetical protein [Nevskiaceae bacterium]